MGLAIFDASIHGVDLHVDVAEWRDGAEESVVGILDAEVGDWNNMGELAVGEAGAVDGVLLAFWRGDDWLLKLAVGVEEVVGRHGGLGGRSAGG